MKNTNIEYLESIGIEGEKETQLALEAMENYGDNKWWLSEDIKVRGYYQLSEEVLILRDMNELKNALVLC